MSAAEPAAKAALAPAGSRATSIDPPAASDDLAPQRENMPVREPARPRESEPDASPHSMRESAQPGESSRGHRRRRSRMHSETPKAGSHNVMTRVLLGGSLIGLFITAWVIISGRNNSAPDVEATDPWAQSASAYQDISVETIDYAQEELPAAMETAERNIDFVKTTDNAPLAPPLSADESVAPTGAQLYQPTVPGMAQAPQAGYDDHSHQFARPDAYQFSRQPPSSGEWREPQRGAAPPPADRYDVGAGNQYLQADRRGYSGPQSATHGYDAYPTETEYQGRMSAGAGSQNRQSGYYDARQNAAAGEGEFYRNRPPSNSSPNRSPAQPSYGGRDASYQPFRPRDERTGSGIY